MITNSVRCPACGWPIFIRPDLTIVAHYNEHSQRCKASETIVDRSLYNQQLEEQSLKKFKVWLTADEQEQLKQIAESFNENAQMALARCVRVAYNELNRELNLSGSLKIRLPEEEKQK